MRTAFAGRIFGQIADPPNAASDDEVRVHFAEPPRIGPGQKSTAALRGRFRA
jgi:hypothetical protein